MKYKKQLFYLITTTSLLCLSVIILANYATNRSTALYTYGSVLDVPECNSALLLGTSQLLRSGHPNHFFSYRINAAVELYESGKISHIVISGDNSIKGYNEPEDMKNALIARDVPADRMILDYAGFNTYDSVHRMKKIFSQNKFIVISQKFHNQRAIYISQYIEGVTAYGCNAQDVDAYNGFRTKMREKLARVKMFLDIIVNRDPKFLGDKINVNTSKTTL